MDRDSSRNQGRRLLKCHPWDISVWLAFYLFISDLKPDSKWLRPKKKRKKEKVNLEVEMG